MRTYIFTEKERGIAEKWLLNQSGEGPALSEAEVKAWRMIKSRVLKHQDKLEADLLLITNLLIYIAEAKTPKRPVKRKGR